MNMHLFPLNDAHDAHDALNMHLFPLNDAHIQQLVSIQYSVCIQLCIQYEYALIPLNNSHIQQLVTIQYSVCIQYEYILNTYRK